MAEKKRIEISPVFSKWFELTCEECNRVFYFGKSDGIVYEKDAICEKCLKTKKGQTVEEIIQRHTAGGGIRRYDKPTQEKQDAERKLRKINEANNSANTTRISSAAIDLEDRIMGGNLRDEDGF